MQGPPAATHHVGKSRWHAAMLLALWLGALGLTGYLAWARASTPMVLLQVLVLLGSAVAAWIAWKRAVTGVLQWDGEAWSWSGADEPGEARVCRILIQWDFQYFVLARIGLEAGGHLWLWLEPQVSTAQWLALRRALTSARTEFTGPKSGWRP